MRNIIHLLKDVCLVTYLQLSNVFLHLNLTSEPLILIGPFGGYWQVWSNYICQNGSKWQNSYMCLNSHNIMYLLIIYYSDMIFSLIICFNSHYKFVQKGTTLFKFSHNFNLFHHYEICPFEITYFEQVSMFIGLLNYNSM